MKDLQRLTAKISACRSFDELQTVWGEVAKFLDFSYGTAVTLMTIGGPRDWKHMVSSAPKEFLEWYNENKLIADDPMVRRLFQSHESFFSDKLNRHELTSAGNKFIFESLKHGMAFACGASHRSPDGFITFAIFTKTLKQIFSRQRTLDSAQWLTTVVHEVLMRLAREESAKTHVGTNVALTEHEKQVLTLTARGFTRKRIGEALGMKDRTVAYYGDAVAEKLGVEDRYVAAKRALIEGQVTLFQPPMRWSTCDEVVTRADPCKPFGALRRETLEMVQEGITASGTLGEMSSNVARVTEALGFTRYSVVLRMATPKSPKQYVLTNLVADLQALGEDPRHLANDPTVGGDIFRANPDWVRGFCGSSVARKDEDGSLQALSFYVRDHRGAHSTVTFMTDGQSIKDDAFEIEFEALKAAREIHDTATRVCREENAGDYLSPLEVDCLVGAAHNEEPKLTAKRLRVSPSKLKRALYDAAHKLGVNTTAEACARATELGLFNSHVRREAFEETEMTVAIGK